MELNVDVRCYGITKLSIVVTSNNRKTDVKVVKILNRVNRA